MKFIYNSLILLIVITIVSCNKSEEPIGPPDPVGSLVVKGTVMLNGTPVQGAIVNIDNVLNWKSITGSDGTFEITGVTKGNHVISAIKSLEQGRTVFQSSPIVTQDPEINIGTLNLPAPVTINEIDPSSTTTLAIPVSWNGVAESEFIEYKLYRMDKAVFDETTGELIHTSPEINSISFTDVNFRTGKTYYYKLYAHFVNGKYAASNVVSVSIPEVNIVVNPDFEESGDGKLPDHWLQTISGNPEFDYFKVTNENVKNGNYSLRVIYIDSLANPDPGYKPWGGLSQTISLANLKAGQNYTITFWARSVIGNMEVHLLKNGDIENRALSFVIPNDQEWTEHNIKFNFDDQTSFLVLLINTKQGLALNGKVQGWIDNIKIIR